MTTFALRHPALLLLQDPFVQGLEEALQCGVEVPIEMMCVVHVVRGREARPEGILEPVPFGTVLLEVDRECPRLDEFRDPSHLLLDNRIDLVVSLRRLVFETADFEEQLLPFAERGEALDGGPGRYAADGV